jgi:hypothetical protein
MSLEQTREALEESFGGIAEVIPFKKSKPPWEQSLKVEFVSGISLTALKKNEGI